MFSVIFFSDNNFVNSVSLCNFKLQTQLDLIAVMLNTMHPGCSGALNVFLDKLSICMGNTYLLIFKTQ